MRTSNDVNAPSGETIKLCAPETIGLSAENSAAVIDLVAHPPTSAPASLIRAMPLFKAPVDAGGSIVSTCPSRVRMKPCSEMVISVGLHDASGDGRVKYQPTTVP